MARWFVAGVSVKLGRGVVGRTSWRRLSRLRFFECRAGLSDGDPGVIVRLRAVGAVRCWQTERHTVGEFDRVQATGWPDSGDPCFAADSRCGACAVNPHWNFQADEITAEVSDLCIGLNTFDFLIVKPLVPILLLRMVSVPDDNVKYVHTHFS